MSLLNSCVSVLLTISGAVAPAVLTVFLISKNSGNNLPNLMEIPEIKVSINEEEIKPVVPKTETPKLESEPSKSTSEEKDESKETTEETLPSLEILSQETSELESSNSSKGKEGKPSPSPTGVRVIKSQWNNQLIDSIKQLIAS